MKYEAEIVTQWTPVTSLVVGGAAHAPLASMLFRIDAWEDTTTQDATMIPPVPNALVIRCVVEKTELDKIKAHPQHHCLWCRPIAGTDPTAEPPDAEIPQTEEQSLHAFLAGRGAKLTDRTLAVGPQTPGRTRRDIARRLKSWMRSLKKAI